MIIIIRFLKKILIGINFYFYWNKILNYFFSNYHFQIIVR